MPANPHDGICNLTQEDALGLFVLEDASGNFILEFCDEKAGGLGHVRPRRTVKWREFERQLEEQRPFTRQRYEELLAAQERAEERAQELAEQDKRKRAEELERAAQATQEALQALPQEIPSTFAREAEALIRALENASSISATYDTMHRARLKAVALRNHINSLEEDDLEVMLLLG